MKQILLALMLLWAFSTSAGGQTQAPVTPGTMPYGKIDRADLEMKECDFEKDAHAMVLFDFCNVYFDFNGVVIDRHKRVKIFDDKANSEGNFKIEYLSINHDEYISGLEAETFNLNNGKVEATRVDGKQIFTERMDASHSATYFAFPNAKPGAVVEFRYRLRTKFIGIPYWFFQSEIPERYSELITEIPNELHFKLQLHVNQPLVKDIATNSAGAGINFDKHIRAMANVASFQEEPFMGALKDNLQSAYFHSTFFGWEGVGNYLASYKYFGYEMKASLPGTREIVKNAKQLPAKEQKLAYIFNEVKNTFKWNDVDAWYTDEGLGKACQSQTGNSAEINLILWNILTDAGVEAAPLLVSTHKNGKVNPVYPDLDQFSRTVVYVPGDNGHFYVLDAINKYNTYNEKPSDLLNSFGLIVDDSRKIFKTVFIEKDKPVKEAVFINAEIKPDGSLEGTAQKSNSSYLKNSVVDNFKKNGDIKYRESLREGDNDLKITDLKLEDMDADTLPLKQSISFKKSLGDSGDGYLYVNLNLFSSLRKNPFVSKERFSDIDFSFLSNYAITGIYKLPANYKTESLPKSTSMEMPDKSIFFRRLIVAQEGTISVRFTVDYRKSIFLKEQYPDLQEFCKKMYEMLNEPIVLKKS